MTVDPRALQLKRRALLELTKAFDESRGELSCDWVRNGDPDLATLRDDPAMQLVMRRYCSGSTTGGGDKEWDGVLRPHVRKEAEQQLRGRPARPWGDPERRATGWALILVACVEAAVLLLVQSLPLKTAWEWTALVALMALVVLAGVRGALAWREAGRIKAVAPTQRLMTTGGRS